MALHEHEELDTTASSTQLNRVQYGFAFLDAAAGRFYVGSASDDASRANLGALLTQVGMRLAFSTERWYSSFFWEFSCPQQKQFCQIKHKCSTDEHEMIVFWGLVLQIDLIATCIVPMQGKDGQDCCLGFIG